jgi:hypothetical protein
LERDRDRRPETTPTLPHAPVATDPQPLSPTNPTVRRGRPDPVGKPAALLLRVPLAPNHDFAPLSAGWLARLTPTPLSLEGVALSTRAGSDFVSVNFGSDYAVFLVNEGQFT